MEKFISAISATCHVVLAGIYLPLLDISSKILCIFSTLSKHLNSSSFFYWRGDPYLQSWRAHLCPLSFWVDCFLLTLIIVHDSIKRHPKGSPALQSNLPYFLYGEAIQFPPAVWIIHPSNTFSFLPSFLPFSLSFLPLFKDFFKCMDVLPGMYVCVLLKNLKWASKSLELELLIVFSHHLGDQNQTQVF